MVISRRCTPFPRSFSAHPAPPRSAAARRAASEGTSSLSVLDRQRISHNYFLKHQQQQSPNLSTVILRDGVTHLATFPYPLTSHGNPVPLHHLSCHMKDRHIPSVDCFCLKPAKYISVGSGEFAGKSAFACRAWQCSFWVVTDDLLASTDGGIDFKLYPARGTRKLPPTSYLTILDRNPVASALASPSSSTSSSSSPTSAYSTCSSNTDGWASVRRLLTYRREGAEEMVRNTAFALSNRDLVPFPSHDPFSPVSVKQEPVSPGLHDLPRLSNAGITVPKPTYPLAGDRDLRVWSPPPPAQVLRADIRAASTTASTSVSVPSAAAVELLTSAAGLGVEEFWELWEYCGGCNMIVSSVLMPVHICDLTRD
ncbi:hypothetical protein B0H16DRAFT_1886535 [Mycena metata]|uniref:Uncharacterized protein n=1 Tax=Mycena metata TaxID=1033252 RepID=A0AAD7J1A9_9AGAR|nr:hypothetical protein B0H16DRAFT_1886535 [Mycena metata]